MEPLGMLTDLLSLLQQQQSTVVKLDLSLIDGALTKVLSPPKRREKEDRIGETQPFRERILSVQDLPRAGIEPGANGIGWSSYEQS
ncbi:hypothetical protein M8J77_013739 [Diaphorina citri]|nr:hypothetical protein M8J77_013739 [Diaphorina citri]